MNRQKQAMLLGLMTVLLWSTVATAFKISLRHMEPVQLLFYASLASITVLTGILAWQGHLPLLLQCSRRQYWQSVALGLINPGLYYLILFKAYDLLPAQEAQPLNYTWALMLTYLSVPLLGQRLRLLDILAGLVCYSGVLVISTRGELAEFRFSDPLGVGLALGSTLIWALYWIANTRDHRDPVVGLLLNFLFGLPAVALICALTSGFEVAHWQGLLGAGYVGLFEMGIAFVLWLKAMKLAENTASISNLIFISPFVSLLFIHWLVGEEILPSTYIGLVLIILGLVVQRLPLARLQRRRAVKTSS